MATVTALNATVLPAVCTVRTTALCGARPPRSSSRYRETHEQAVVDGEAEPHTGREVEREDRHLGERREHEEHEEGADDRQDAHHQGETGGDDAPEHEHREQQDDREREELATQ